MSLQFWEQTCWNLESEVEAQRLYLTEKHQALCESEKLSQGMILEVETELKKMDEKSCEVIKDAEDKCREEVAGLRENLKKAIDDADEFQAHAANSYNNEKIREKELEIAKRENAKLEKKVAEQA